MHKHRTDEPTIVNHHGGAQSQIAYKPSLVPGEIFPILEPYFAQDIASGTMLWRNTPTKEYVNLALSHMHRFLNSNNFSDLHDAFVALIRGAAVEDQLSKENLLPCIVPPEAILRISEICAVGAEKYALNNWRLLTFQDQIDHAIGHLYKWFAGDASDDHLGNALCRLSFAVSIEPKVLDFKAVVQIDKKIKE